MKTLDQHPQTTTKITNSVTPRHPDPLVIISALRASMDKIKSLSC
ncbi:MAG: hypothetical protein ACRDS0_36645 [Pseudonocardiaceae bacterium]